MPPPSAYTSRRRLMMQAALIVLLGGTLGLAALLAKHRQAQQVVPFVGTDRWSTLAVPRLQGWIARGSDRDATGPYFATAAVTVDERGRVVAAREIRVRSQSLPPGTAIGKLADDMTAKHQFNGWRPVGDRDEVMLGGRRTVVARFETNAATDGGEPVPSSLLVACSLLPDGRGLVVELEVIGRPARAPDLNLLMDFAEAVKPVSAEKDLGGE